MPPSRRRADPSSPLVLVIDDAEDTRDVYAQFLHHVGFRAATAVDGEDGLEKALALRPHLIVLDLGLPKIDGATRDIPLIVVSGHAQPEQRSKAAAAGVDEYCVKPCTPDELVTMIRRHLT
jgi:DNA-binding response OmpR family regulator